MLPHRYGRQLKTNVESGSSFFLFVAFCFISLGSVDQSQAQDVKDEAYYFKSGRQAYEEQRYEEAESQFRKADSLRPNHPAIVEYLAMACGQTRKHQCALRYLNRLGLMNADLSLLEKPAFESVRSTPEFGDILELYRSMNETVSNSDTAFTIPEKGLHPESIAYRKETGSFFISSIRKRKVLQRDDTGKFEDYADSSDGLFAASGLAVDEKRGVLWVSSPATRQMEGYPESDSLYGTSYIFKFDLHSGELLQRYGIYDVEKHYFGDLIVHTNGDLYVTDSYYPAIYQIKQGSNWLELFMQFEYLRSLQGITLSEDGRHLWFADYIEGIFRIDLNTERVIQIQAPEGTSLKGIDGLAYYQQSLVLIQNGVFPKRITRVYLDVQDIKIRDYEYLEKNNPVLDEPTLGTIVNDLFYYVGNSPWGKYDSEGNLPETEDSEKSLILKIRLID